MGQKIKKVGISGLRGVKESLTLDLNQRSILIYGENGTGKSSISDSMEWFFTDCVSHLSSSEIEMKEAIRNSNLEEDMNSQMNISFTRSQLDSSKEMFYKRGKLVCQFSNDSPEFDSYLKNSEKENFLLRYQYLRDFIDQTKGDKLKHLSDIIGYSSVTKAKDVLKKCLNNLKSELKTQNFETLISTQKQTLIEKIGATVSQEQNLFEKVNEIIGGLGIEVTVATMADLDLVLEKLKSSGLSSQTNELRFLEGVRNIVINLMKEVGFVDEEYKKFFVEHGKLSADVQSIMQIFFKELLTAGGDLLQKKYHKQESCPLCLQPKSQDELLKEIRSRLIEIEESSKKKTAFDSAKTSIVNLATERSKRIESVTNDITIKKPEYSEVRAGLVRIIEKLNEYLDNTQVKVTSGKGLRNPTELYLEKEDFVFVTQLEQKIDTIKKQLETNNNVVVYSNLSAAKDAFLKIKGFEKQKEVLEKQRASMSIIFEEFVRRQKEGLENFISTFSGSINEYYQYMNRGELFHEIRIATIGEEDELNGLTIEYKYQGEWVSPPQKYFSESHLNCFGISFFLASAVAFNKLNDFLILDDVISSFDTNHRKRFADLLFEKFSDKQIVLLTHDEEWYQYVSQLAKKKSWSIKEVRWSNQNGTHFDSKPVDLKELIASCLAEGGIELIGNPMRKYLEHILKDICFNLEVKLSFRFNDINEKRMPDELLTCLKSKIEKDSKDLKAKNPVIDRVINSSVLGNLLSHDNPFTPKLGDLKAFWADVMELEKLFYCQEVDCTKPSVSLKNYDTVAKKIRCGCDKTKYDWKK